MKLSCGRVAKIPAAAKREAIERPSEVHANNGLLRFSLSASPCISRSFSLFILSARADEKDDQGSHGEGEPNGAHKGEWIAKWTAPVASNHHHRACKEENLHHELEKGDDS